MNMEYIGIDLSLTGTGIVKIDNSGQVIETHLIKSNPSEGTTNSDIKRITGMIREIGKKVVDHQGPELGIEGFSFGSRGNTVLQNAYLGYRVREHILRSDLCYRDISPGEVKKYATGKGNIKKNLILLEVYKRWGQTFDDDNIADAYVLARMIRDYHEEEKNLTKFQKLILKNWR